MKESLNKKITIFSPFLNPVGVKRATFGLAKMFSKNGYYVDMPHLPVDRPASFHAGVQVTL